MHKIVWHWHHLDHMLIIFTTHFYMLYAHPYEAYASMCHTHTQSFTALLEFVQDYPGEQVPERQNQELRKGKTNLDLLEQEIVSGSGICWAICKSAPHPRQPRQHPTTQFFYRADALPAAQPTALKAILCFHVLVLI